MEKWKYIKNSPDYQVSNLGSVRSLKFGKVKILRPRLVGKPGNQYYQVIFYTNGQVCSRPKVHALVGLYFVSNPKKLNRLNHLNRNKLDNRSVNLEWCTHRENSTHGWIGKSVSRYAGVTHRKDTGKWSARIHYNGKPVRLGQFDSEVAAGQAYKNALKKFNIINRYAA
jgi:hypothetical protein